MIITKQKSRADPPNMKQRNQKNILRTKTKPTRLKGQKHKGKQTKEVQSNQKTKDKMTALSLHISRIILQINGLITPIKSTKYLDGLKTKLNHMLLSGHPSQLERLTQAPSEEVEDETSRK